MVDAVIAKIADIAPVADAFAASLMNTMIVQSAMVVQSAMSALVSTPASSVTIAILVADVAMVHAMDTRTGRIVPVSRMVI
jgi:hypothetical protein